MFFTVSEITATYSFEHSIQICGQTAADGHMVTIDSL